MKGVMRHTKVRVCVHKGTAGQTVGYAIGHSIRRGQICLFGGTIELILSRKRKAAKKDGRVHAKK